MVAVASSSKPFVAVRTLEWLQIKMDAKVALEVAKLPHLLVANFALENISINAACFLTDVVLSDAIAADVFGGLQAVITEDASRRLCILIERLRLEIRNGFLLCQTLFLEVLNRMNANYTIVGSCEFIDCRQLVMELKIVIKERVGDF